MRALGCGGDIRLIAFITDPEPIRGLRSGCDATPAFLPARPITAADLAAVTERVRRRVIRWFRLTRLIDAEVAAEMLGWEHSGFSIDASVLIVLIDRVRRPESALFSRQAWLRTTLVGHRGTASRPRGVAAQGALPFGDFRARAGRRGA